ncbi:hypothetical protein B296_00025287 [Ensete ventricosum]|uniref:Uncharacterized protein n=1 Tax=Ensete ventricosum TaxID=4639 RepID=A0A426XI64_ENSVE|nr:hypothetical protein B296_00025287 [Ensete ventricosum]
MGVAVCLSIGQGKLLREHRGVEEGDRKGRGSDNESRGAQLPKSKALVIKEVDSKECYSVAEADLLVAKKGTDVKRIIRPWAWQHHGTVEVERSRQYVVLYLFYLEE